MAETAPTATATKTETALNLTPPDPVPVVTAEKAAGLVPVDAEKKSKLEEKVEGFVNELVALDANSPDFGKKVDQITNMGRKEIAAAAGMSNRFLDRPIRAMDKDIGRRGQPVGAAQGGRGPRPGPQWGEEREPQVPRHHPVRQQADRLFPQVPERADATSSRSSATCRAARTSC